MAVEDWQVAVVADAIKRATDVGTTRTRAALQEECGIGSGDISAVLDGLREKGMISEVAPGEFDWSGGTPAPPVEADVEMAAPAADPLPGRPRRAQEIVIEDDPERETVLSRAMVESLDPVALGGLVLAGVQAEDGVFILRVEP